MHATFSNAIFQEKIHSGSDFIYYFSTTMNEELVVDKFVTLLDRRELAPCHVSFISIVSISGKNVMKVKLQF